MTIRPPEYFLAPLVLRPRTARILSIVENEVRERATALNFVLLGFIFTVVLLPLILVFYLADLIPARLRPPVTLALFYEPFGVGVWIFFLILLVSSVGAAIIAGDLATRSITLYFARPIRRSDYLAAKAGAAGIWMLLGTVLPGLIGVVIVLAVGYVSLPLALEAAGGYILVGLLAVVTLTALALLLSSFASKSTYAGASIFGALIGSQVVAEVLSSVARQPAFGYVSPGLDLLAVANGVFSVGGNPLSPWYAAGVLLAFSTVAFGLTFQRLERSEAPSE